MLTTRGHLLRRLSEIVADLKRRRVLKVAFMYAAGGWVFVSGAAELVDIQAISPGLARGVLLTVIAGFPVALVLGWVFDIGPEGVKRSPPLQEAGKVEGHPQGRPDRRDLRQIRELLRTRSRENLQLALDRAHSFTHRFPDDASGQALSARALALLAEDGALPRAPTLATARAAAARALELDPDLGDAHATLGFVSSLEWDWEAAAHHLRLGAAQRNADADAHHWLALYLATVGRLDEALQSISRALLLDPRSARRLTAAAGLRYYARQPERALSDASKALEFEPDKGFARVVTALAHEQRQSYGPARDALKNALAEAAVPRPFLLAALAHVQASSGDRVGALRMLDVLERENALGEEPSYFGLACVQAALGLAAPAISSLEQAVARHDGWIPSLCVHPWADPLKAVPGFAGLLEEAGLAHAGERIRLSPASA
jgi:tetratricopeptide (TPR) repeat protein